ncbi:MAG: recombinase, partial [Burkholderiales bacterium]|nr:recombinase [Burkholderiales bacterium]
MTEARSGLEAVLDRIATSVDPSVTLLAELVSEIRPADPHDGEQALKNFQAVEFLLHSHPRWRDGLRRHLIALTAARHQTTVYADLGILPGTGFFSELRRRLSERILPAAIDAAELRDALGIAFPKRTDHVWIDAIDDVRWCNLFDIIGVDFFATEGNPTVPEVLDAIQILAARIASMGVEPELARVFPQLREHRSPFLAQQAEVQHYLDAVRGALDAGQLPEVDERHVRVLLDQCRNVISRIRRGTGHTGISVALTYLLQRLSETVDRLELLLEAVDRTADCNRTLAAVRLLKACVRAENHKNDLREHFARNTELLAREVTEHSGRTGEHYITANRGEYRAMFASALGAGLIVPFMALIKIGMHDLHPAPLVEALMYGLNYAMGFMLIHVLHFTLATKQPAMTAARIAATLEHAPGAKPDLAALVELIVRVSRSQFIAVVGNIALAFPLAYLLAWALFLSTDVHIASADKAHSMLHDVHPWKSLALFHAAIAGVYLFLSGLISGYYDNLAIFNRIPERLAQLPWLRRLLGETRAGRLANYIEHTLG